MAASQVEAAIGVQGVVVLAINQVVEVVMVKQVVVEEHLAANLHEGVGEEDNRMVGKPDSQDKSQTLVSLSLD